MMKEARCENQEGILDAKSENESEKWNFFGLK